ADLLVGKMAMAPLKKGRKVYIDSGVKIDAATLAKIPLAQLESLVLKDPKISQQVHEILERYRDQRELCRLAFEQQVSRFEKGDDLPPGVIKMVKVYVAMKRKLSVGDKMAGRHGNKGVVSRVLPVEDLPYFEDGTPVDMVLNPLGVPSRMNVGQILEIHLGRAAKGLGEQLRQLIEAEKVKAVRDKVKKIFATPVQRKMINDLNDNQLMDFVDFYKDGVHMATPVFDGAKEDEIKALLDEAGLEKSGQATLYDGRSGEPFDDKVTVGTMYVMKLHHLVDDKIHARSIGPYSLVTQQPLGGKAQFGGQRLGEMEVWAMEAYGAAYALQEFLTVKSDDMAGRTRMYEKIVKGQNVLEPGIPESFRVMTKELQALGLDIALLEETEK
ncbi:MAG: DNA-directed RNA polymerase subunit beta, partial [Desulfobacterales bacterium]